MSVTILDPREQLADAVRFCRAQRHHPEAGQEAGKDFAAKLEHSLLGEALKDHPEGVYVAPRLGVNFTEPWLVKVASGVAGASPAMPNAAGQTGKRWGFWRRLWWAIRGH